MDCRKTFNNISNTPFSRSSYPEKWIKYIKNDNKRCYINEDLRLFKNPYIYRLLLETQDFRKSPFQPIIWHQ